MSNPLLQYVPSYERKSTVFIEIFDAELNQFKKIESSLDDIKKQFNVDTATWGLSIYEKELGIKTPNNNPILLRRAHIKSKLRSGGKVDAELIRTASGAYSTGKIKVLFQEGIIYVDFLGEYASHLMNDELIDLLESLIPAHLPLVMRFFAIARIKNRIASSFLSGEAITVFPWTQTLVESKAKSHFGTSTQATEQLTVYP